MPATNAVAAAEHEAITNAYRNALLQRGAGYSGTALLGLESLSRRHPDFDRESVGREAEALAADDGTCEASRITALRVAALMGRSGTRGAARCT
jgi:hypothetical protein